MTKVYQIKLLVVDDEDIGGDRVAQAFLNAEIPYREPGGQWVEGFLYPQDFAEIKECHTVESGNPFEGLTGIALEAKCRRLLGGRPLRVGDLVAYRSRGKVGQIIYFEGSRAVTDCYLEPSRRSEIPTSDLRFIGRPEEGKFKPVTRLDRHGDEYVEEWVEVEDEN